MAKEAAVVAPPLACHSAMVLRFYGGVDFLHKHSQLRISSLQSPQAVSLQPTAVLSPGLLSKPHSTAPIPPSALGDTLLRLGLAGPWHRPSV